MIRYGQLIKDDGQFDPRKQRGTMDFGWNATGVIRSKLHFTGDEIISEDTMPQAGLDAIMDDVAALSTRVKNRKEGGVVGGKIPLTLFYSWRQEWENTKKQQGMLWTAFLISKLMDGDFKRLRTMNL